MKLLQAILIGRKPHLTLVRMAVTAVICVIVCKYAVRPARVEGESMEPTISSSGIRFINLLAYTSEGPRRGDIVAIRMAGNNMFYLKRVLALPGETIEMRYGALWINNQETDEPYLYDRGTWTLEPHVLGEGEYWVAGDNRSMPIAFHMQGKTHRRSIAGKLL